jgi:hypothetical protein
MATPKMEGGPDAAPAEQQKQGAACEAMSRVAEPVLKATVRVAARAFTDCPLVRAGSVGGRGAG